MNLSEFLVKTDKLDKFEDLFAHATGVRPALGDTILVPVYTTSQDWEADFSEACRPTSDETLLQPYARYVRSNSRV